MSKNSYRPGVNQYANQEEARRKARGNPNKNVHQKKKNSNYAGYAGNPVTQKIIEKANQQERVKLPTWLNIWLAVLFAAIIVVLILRLAVYKDSILLSSLSSLLLGIACLSLFYIRRFKHTKKEYRSVILRKHRTTAMKETRPASLPREESRRLVQGGRAAGLGYHSRASA